MAFLVCVQNFGPPNDGFGGPEFQVKMWKICLRTEKRMRGGKCRCVLCKLREICLVRRKQFLRHPMHRLTADRPR